MTSDIIKILSCPRCNHAPLVFENSKNGDGAFGCSKCRSRYDIKNGVPVFLPENLRKDVAQVRSSYSDKWNKRPDIYNEGTYATKEQREWHLQRYHWKSENDFKEFLSKKRTILDAGCGLGRDVRWYATLNPQAQVTGADLSDSVFVARDKCKDYKNIAIIQSDLNHLPFSEETFDLVMCDQVLPCVENPKDSVKKLWSLVKKGGHFCFYVYKEKCPIHEFTDDYLREKISKMDSESAWKACENITRLGKALTDIHAELTIPSDIPELGIKKGSYDIQRFIYYNVIKCYWNENMSFDDSNLVNFDWYHPAYTYRHTEEEVLEWTAECNMEVIVLDSEDQSGISVLAKKK